MSSAATGMNPEIVILCTRKPDKEARTLIDRHLICDFQSPELWEISFVWFHPSSPWDFQADENSHQPQSNARHIPCFHKWDFNMSHYHPFGKHDTDILLLVMLVFISWLKWYLPQFSIINPFVINIGGNTFDTVQIFHFCLNFCSASECQGSLGQLSGASSILSRDPS